MQYIDHTQQQTNITTNIQRLDDPITTRTRMATNHNRYAAHNHNSKDLEYDLTSQQRTSLNQTNDHLDVQVYVQIRVIWHPFQIRTSRPSQTRLITNISPQMQEMALAEHFEFWNLKRFHSLGITVIVERQLKTNFMSLIPASWTFFKTMVLDKDLSSPGNREKRK